MTIPILILLLLLCLYHCFAQENNGQPTSKCLVPTPTTGFCSYPLCDTCTALPFDSVKQDLGINYGKYYHSSTYPGDIKFKNENTPDTCVNNDVSGFESCRTDSTGDLHYDVYYPSKYTHYSTCPLPAVIYVHGGGFSDCIKISKAGGDSFAIAFAERGFVFFNVEYRTGVEISPSKNYPYTTVQQQLAEYRASQDARGAIRTIILRQKRHDSVPALQRTLYQIDTSNIFIGGNSAGAITVLNVAYYTRQAMLDSINPYSGTVSIQAALGPIDADYYVGDTNVEYHSKIKGVLAQWGSLTLPQNFDTSTARGFFDQRIPIICFHGLKDPIVDPNIKAIKFALYDGSMNGYKDTFSSEKSCLITGPFKTVGGSSSQPDDYTYGSSAYVQYIMRPLNIRYEAYFDCDAMHGLRNAGSVYKADYGTGYTSSAPVNKYIVGRAATFFQTIIGGANQTTHKIFVECPNYRVTCTQGNNDAGCLNTDVCGTHPH